MDDYRADQPRVKRMRKGTKSCAECRRRKIKCIYEPTRADVCRDCFERGSACVDQEHAEMSTRSPDSQSLKGRVSQLEDLVKTLVGKLDEKTAVAPAALQHPAAVSSTRTSSYERSTVYASARPPIPVSPATSIAASPASQSALSIRGGDRSAARVDLGPAPMIGLFDNAVVSPQGGWSEEATTATAQDMPDASTESDRESTLRRTLLSLFPSKETYLYLCRNYGGWWEDWSYMMPEFMLGNNLTLARFVEQAIRDGDNIILAQALMSLAMSLQKMPSDAAHPGIELPLSPHKLSDHYVSQVQRLVLSDDDIVGTFEGIAVMLIYTKFCMDVGRPRKGWLALRRAITFAQLLGLHRKSSRSVPSPGCSAERKTYLWIDMYMIDQMVALQLGQPYTIHREHSDMTKEDLQNFPPEMAFMFHEATIAGRIVDRNQDLFHKPINTCYSTTLQLDQDLDDLEKTMPRDWSSLFEPQAGSRDPKPLLIRFLHYQARQFLHMPWMLRSAAERRFDTNRLAALDASRNLLKTYKIIMALQEYPCKAIDFQAFTAAMLLCINLLGYDPDDSGNTDADWSLVRDTMDLLRSTAHEIGGKVSAQCVRVLEVFADVHKHTASEMRKEKTAKVIVPFFGTLVLAPGKGFDKSKLRASCQEIFPPDSSLPTPPFTKQSSDSNVTSPSSTSLSSYNEPFIGFDSFANPFPLDGLGTIPDQSGMNWPQGSSSMGSDSHLTAWPTAFNMDLDHDWSWYLGNSAQDLEKVPVT